MKNFKNLSVSRMGAAFAVLIAAVMVLSFTATVLADSEPNDDFYDANYTYDGDYTTGTLDSATDTYDYYKIYLYSGDTFDCTITSLDTGLYISASLYNDYYSTVSYADSSHPYNIITYDVTSYGYFYIEIEAVSGSGSYSMEIEVSSTPIVISDDIYVGGSYYTSGAPLAELPTLTVGNSAYFGGIKDIGEEYKAELDEALADFEDLGFDVKYDVSGGAGAYFGWEVASNSADIGGVTCYDIAITGAIAVDFGLEGSVDGTVSESGYSISVDGSGSGFVEFEATLDGHMYLTVDELAIAKIQLTLKADGQLEANLDAKASAMGENMNVNADISGSIEGAEITFQLEFDPPLDIFQYGTGNGAEGIYQGKEWYVPAVDTTVSGSITAQGTVTYDVNMEMTGETPVHEQSTANLATEIGDSDFSEEIPGGEPEYYWDSYGGGTLFTCTYASGSVFVIETELGDAFGMIDTSSILPGTRQFDSFLDPTSMMPQTGMQLDSSKGMPTGMTMDGEAMTEPATQADVESFVDDPLGEVTSETGGHSTGMGSMLVILVIVIVIVVVVVVVLMVVMKKKTPPPQQYPQPWQPAPGYDQGYQQQGYQQPPPPPQQYPPQGQYPPPPPPPGQ